MTAAQFKPSYPEDSQALMRPITAEECAAFRRDGAVLLRNLLPLDWIEHLRKGFDALESRFGPDALIEHPNGGRGRYVNDQIRWLVIPEFYDFAMESPVAEIAATVMDSRTVNFFLDQYFIKDAGTVLPTPWHQDQPYLSVSGRHVVRLWVPVDPAPASISVQFALGSHLDAEFYRPAQPVERTNYQYDERMPPMPDAEAIRRRWRIAAWDSQPGDCVAFHAAIVHGASAGELARGRVRVAAYLWTGDDARYTIRPGRNMPPLPVPDVADGGPLDSPAFPRVWPRPVPDALLAMRPPRPASSAA